MVCVSDNMLVCRKKRNGGVRKRVKGLMKQHKLRGYTKYKKRMEIDEFEDEVEIENDDDDAKKKFNHTHTAYK